MRVLVLHTPDDGNLVGSFVRAARDLGCACEYFDLDGAIARAGRHVPGRLARRLARAWIWGRASRDLVAQFGRERFDLLLQVKGREYAPGALRSLKRSSGAPLVVYYPDSPVVASSSSRWLWRSLPIVDLFYVFDESFVDCVRRGGCRDVRVLPFARDPALHHVMDLPPARRAELASELAFVGTWGHDRQAWLEAVCDHRLAIWGDAAGGSWGGPLASLYRGGPAGPELTCEVFAATRIVLNFVRNWQDLRASPPRTGGEGGGFWGQGHNMRSFEAPACGAFVLSTRTEQLVRMFREDAEMAYFSSIEELRSKVRYFIDHDDERRAIAAAGMRRVEGETYEARMREILEAALGLLPR